MKWSDVSDALMITLFFILLVFGLALAGGLGY